MKHLVNYILPLMAVALLSATASCRHGNEKLAHGALIQFEDTILDLGDVPLTEIQHFSFRFTNVGDSGLVLLGVQPDCNSCTKVEFPSDTIPPGGSEEIHVTFDGSERFIHGPHQFYIHVHSNSAKAYQDLEFRTDFL
ncbi:MAG: DUF1573 domain-containing protein [Bacteroidaceae bacterium]|nr:DUF1573 domain-containing protein [Bacteroidaceae bacterium]